MKTPTQSVRSFFIESKPHTLTVFPPIYSYILYTPSLSANCVQLCKCACALPVNSLQSNPCQGTQSLEYIRSAVLGQTPGIELSIYHAILNPPRENELWVFKDAEFFCLAGKWCNGCDEVFCPGEISKIQQQKKKAAVLIYVKHM